MRRRAAPATSLVTAAAAATLETPTTPLRQRRAPATSSIIARAAPETTTSTTPPSAPSTKPLLDLQERANFLRQDLPNLFTEKGVDPAAYAPRVAFLDPITRYSSLSGYMFNIRFLTKAFSPLPLRVHGMRLTSPTEITSRWTMTMRFAPARLLPGGGKLWDPRIEFTGTSAYGFDAATGKIVRHVDTWDSIERQDFFSLEAFGDFLRQLANLKRTPQGLEQPPCETLRRHSTFSVRRYASFDVAEAPLDGVGEAASSSSSSYNPAGRSVGAFRALAAYLFGGNAQGKAMAMTTPVLSDSAGRMQFVLPSSSSSSSSSSTPSPLPGSPVKVRSHPGGLFAVREFSGVATPALVASEASALRADVAAAGFALKEGSAVRLARYNDPSVKPRFRRNEVLLALDEQAFDLWKGGPGEGAPEL
jgi:hypothetical protein